MTGWLFSSSATTEGTRFEPSSPGMTTGLSPCMKATREFVVPRSMPTMRSVAIVANAEGRTQNSEVTPLFLLLHSDFILLTLCFQNFPNIPHQIADVIAAVQQVHHLVALLHTLYFRNGLAVLFALDHSIPHLPV